MRPRSDTACALQQQSLFNDDKSKLRNKLETALQFVLDTCVFGAGNKAKDVKKTNAWGLFVQGRYNLPGRYVDKPSDKAESLNYCLDADNGLAYVVTKWNYQPKESTNDVEILLSQRFAQDPLDDDMFSHQHDTLLFIGMLTMLKRQGNCKDRACLLAKYFWENSKGIHRIEVVKTSTFDHAFVIVNRARGSSLANSAEWGNAWIVDAWFENEKGKGIIFPASKFEKKIKEIKKFAIEQLTKLKKMRITGRQYTDTDAPEVLQLCNDIDVHHDRYPTYSRNPFLPLEYYYQIDNEYPADVLRVLSNSYQEHRQKFKSCLAEIEKGAADLKRR